LEAGLARLGVAARIVERGAVAEAHPAQAAATALPSAGSTVSRRAGSGTLNVSRYRTCPPSAAAPLVTPTIEAAMTAATAVNTFLVGILSSL
jgi:hypothetical protein